MKPNMLEKEKAAMAMIMMTCEQGMGQRGGAFRWCIHKKGKMTHIPGFSKMTYRRTALSFLPIVEQQI